MRFEALEVSLQIIRELRGFMPQIIRHDHKLAAQLKAAASSVSLNVGEARRRVGKDRLHHFRIAAGSANEVQAALRVCQAWGYVNQRRIEKSLALLDRELRLLWGLSK